MTSTSPGATSFELASEAYSFRDPDSHVSLTDQGVVRTFAPSGAAQLFSFLETGAYQDLLDKGWLAKPLAVERLDDGGAIIHHREIPLWNYPYEWTWSMLRDAAILHLDILQRCHQDGVGLSDANSFNITFENGKPLFIDFGSFVERPGNEPWWAFTQFCEHFLYPLMIVSHTGVELGPLLRGNLGRVSMSDAYAILKSHKRRKGVMKYVILPHLADKKTDLSVSDAKESTVAMNDKVYSNILSGLRGTIEALSFGVEDSTWSDYSTRSHYSDHGLQAKQDFVEQVVRDSQARTVLDIGANDGFFARTAAKHAEQVIAMDFDHLVVDALYRSNPPSNVLPLVMQATSPTPAMGWRLAERSSFATRIQPDLILALAVLHHIALGDNVPLAQIAQWLYETGADLVVEFVHREDEKVQHLLSRKTAPERFSYGREDFEAAIGGLFDIRTAQVLPGGSRSMYHLVRACEPKE